MHLHQFPEGLAFVSPFLEGHGAFVYDQDLAPTVRMDPSFERHQPEPVGAARNGPTGAPGGRRH